MKLCNVKTKENYVQKVEARLMKQNSNDDNVEIHLNNLNLFLEEVSMQRIGRVSREKIVDRCRVL